jgi:hypothetical protein
VHTRETVREVTTGELPGGLPAICVERPDGGATLYLSADLTPELSERFRRMLVPH